uniref:Radical SAM protein n=1 Tax=Thermodesulfobacterium geofontis TaxID=1295609 RepID=A0A7V4JPS3_9BACT
MISLLFQIFLIKKDGKFYHNPFNENFVDLNSLPIPDFNLVEGYNPNKLKIYPISTSRGCPYNCIFCAVVPVFGRKYRFRNEDLVIEELKNLKKIEHIFFYDDNFAADKERAKILLEKMIKMKFKGTWSTQVRIDIYQDKELLKLMEKSNCSILYIGFESIKPETLKLYKKGITPAQIEEGIKTLHKYNIKVHGMFVIGADTDTKESILATLDFSKKLKIDSVQFLILTPVPGSRIFQEFLNKDRIFTTNWDYYDGHHVVFYPRNMSPFELQELAFKLFEGFYSYKSAIKYLLKLDWMHSTIHFLGTKLTKKQEKKEKSS